MLITSFRRRQGYGGQAGAGRDYDVLPKRQDTNDVYNYPPFKKLKISKSFLASHRTQVASKCSTEGLFPPINFNCPLS